MTSSADRRTGPWRALALPRVYSALQSGLARSGTRAEIAERYIRAQPGDAVLDVGCGPADTLALLPAVDYLGVDHNGDYVCAARARYGAARPTARFEQVDVTMLTAERAAHFDIVLAQALLHHLSDEQATGLLEVAQALLKPGGRLVTVDPAVTDGQHPIARLLTSSDRGRFVRSRDGYEQLAGAVFGDVTVHVRHDLMRLPYTHVIMECRGG